jgi:hypothetical protein
MPFAHPTIVGKFLLRNHLGKINQKFSFNENYLKIFAHYRPRGLIEGMVRVWKSTNQSLQGGING